MSTLELHLATVGIQSDWLEPQHRWPRALTEANTQSFDICSGEVYGLELVAGMIFTAEVQFNWRLRMWCGSKTALRSVSEDAFHHGK